MKHEKHATRCINKLANKLRRKIDAFSSKEEFSGSQGRTIHFILSRSTDVFQKDIEEEYCLRPSTATELLKKMEKNGLIYREPMANDARMKRIIATEKALQYKDIVIENITTLEDKLINGISEEDLKIFFKVIEKMLDNVN